MSRSDRIALLGLSALALTMAAGCHRQAQPAGSSVTIHLPQAPVPAPGAQPSGDVRQALLALPAGQQKAVLLRAVEDAGGDCSGTTNATRGADIDGNLVWTMACGSDAQWTIVVDGKGNGQVVRTKPS